MKNSLSRRIYNSSLTLAISFGFYALIFAFTLSCDAEESPVSPTGSATEEVVLPDASPDSAIPLADETVSYVEKVTN